MNPGHDFSFSIGFVIPTHNRPTFLERALKSLDSIREVCEIIVVDDASTLPNALTPAVSRPHVKVVRLNQNLGPGPARDIGIKESTRKFLVMMDDDDVFQISSWNEFLSVLDRASTSFAEFPVLFFATSHSSLPNHSHTLRENDLIEGPSVGECKPVIHTSVWKNANLNYPETRIGGEGLLWLQIARLYGIPSWNISITQYETDAPNRLSSVDRQIKNAREHAEIQLKYLDLYKSYNWDVRFPVEYDLRQKAAITYRLLAGDRKAARLLLRQTKGGGSLARLRRAFWVLFTFFPTAVHIAAFRVYRTYGDRRAKSR